MQYSTPSGVKYAVLPVATLRPYDTPPEEIRATHCRAPIGVALLATEDLDYRYLHRCFDKVMVRNGIVCLLAKSAWVGFADGRTIINNIPERNSSERYCERFFEMDGTEVMYVFNHDSLKTNPDTGLLEELANTVFDRALRSF